VRALTGGEPASKDRADQGDAAMPAKPQVIALEEHFQHPEVGALYGPLDANRAPQMLQRLEDLGELRIKEMDEAGIDIQVISHSAPAMHKMEADSAVRLARLANDRLHAAVRAHPTRFAGFASLPMPDPRAAADELERAVIHLGFKGAMVHGLTNGVFLDDRRFWPIFERAQMLDVPIYLHPSVPNQAVIDAYYQDLLKEWPGLLRAAWGFTVETATQGVRLVLSGVFDAYPRLRFIMGHLGEGLPFYLWRINMALGRESTPGFSFRDVFTGHFTITTSGFWSDPALLLCVQEMGVDRIMFSVDYPFAPNQPATQWLEKIPLCAEDRAKIAGGNAKRILKL
jgi:predicted TIM-barrel fold metal-dependent hydrolase